MQNISAAWQICNRIGVIAEDFYAAIPSFTGASKRLELVAQGENTIVYKDFAHAPSKLQATTRAAKEQYPDRKLVACVELHTYSSLNKAFIQQYQDTLKMADVGVVYHNPDVSRHKKLEPLTEEVVREAFDRDDLQVFTKPEEIESF